MEWLFKSLDQFRAFLEEGQKFTQETTRKLITENVALASTVGTSFSSLSAGADLKLSFRYFGEDITVERLLRLFQVSGHKKAILLIPGLFCDETVWSKQPETGISLETYFRKMGYFPLLVRMHPGVHIYQNGKALNTLLNELYKFAPDFRYSSICYSQGALVLRSALYQNKIYCGEDWGKNLDKVLFAASPDGGSYIEKLGYWIGNGLEYTPMWILRMVGIVGNMRAEAMKDLSHGLIREEDVKNLGQIKRYTAERYFGELDGMDIYQVIGLMSEKPNDFFLKDWLGDGVVEKDSLYHLTDRVFKSLPNPELRSTTIYAKNHFSLISAPEFQEVLDRILITS